MGIDVDAAKVVTFNPAHEQRVATDPARPIATMRLDALEIVSIFRRRRAKHDDDDGNPLIYALKGKFGFTMPVVDLRALVRAGHSILPRAIDGFDADLIAPLPSSSRVADIIARRVAKTLGGPPVVNCLEKATVAQVLAAAPATDAVRQRDRGIYTSQLARLQGLPLDDGIEMKSVTMRVRPYLTPIAANALAEACAGRHVLLVDDIVGSGSSLVAAQTAVLAAGAAKVSALTLLSRLS